MTASQLAAFQANGGFTPAATASLLISAIFAVLLLWGAWAMHVAYVGWADNRLTNRQFLVVVVRFTALYLVLSVFLLS